ncbi:conserved hypothetical protein [metagenome]|uniref:Uncharacterized protein n=1 Tax=metagenome TaxID=256318 RepID=A0A2P2BY18_9ZZZZ
MGFRKKKTLMDQAGDLVDQILPVLESAVDTAKEKAVPLYQDAKEKAVPLYQDAKDRAVPLYNDAVESAKPLLAQGRAMASEKAALGAAMVADAAASGKDLATAQVAKVADLKPEPEKKKGGKLKKVLIITGVAGLAAFAYKKLTASDDSWQSAYTPTPPPAPAKPAAPAAAAAPVADEPTADDAAAASPDEALADAVEEPHEVTTPDDPAEVVEIVDGEPDKT